MTEQEQMLTSILDCRRIDLYVHKTILNEEHVSQLQQMVTRRNNGEPLQYILGNCDFMGLTFLVDERVLIPRPETENVVEAAIKKAMEISGKELDILDVGCGSGNIAVTLAKNLPWSQVTAIDISPGALDLAKINAAINGVKEQIHFIESDLFSELQHLLKKEPFDVIVSNPPYIATVDMGSLPSDVQREPRIALNGGADGLDFYRRIIFDSIFYLKRGGHLILEIGEKQRGGIEKIFERYPRYTNISCQKDLAGRDRIMIAELK